MKILRLMVLPIMLMVFIKPAIAEESACYSDQLKDQLQSEIENIVKKNDLPGVNVGVWIPNKVEWVQSFGVSDKRTREKLTLEHHFRIGSVTKTFVATAILQLVDQGKLSLDDKVSKYVDNVPSGDCITIRNLANMTSGLANYTENEKWVDDVIFTKKQHHIPTQELLDVAFAMPMTFKAGNGWKYSNTNAVLLGQVIEKASGMSLAEYLQKNIFTPLKLSSTSYPSDSKIPTPYAHGYSKQTTDGKEADVSSHSPSWANAAGQMISTLDDLKIWAKALGTGDLLSKEAFAERTKWIEVPPNTKDRKYGFGVGFNNGWINHTGEIPGYNTVVAYLPEQDASIVVLVNTDIHPKDHKQISPAELISNAISKILTPENVIVINRNKKRVCP